MNLRRKVSPCSGAATLIFFLVVFLLEKLQSVHVSVTKKTQQTFFEDVNCAMKLEQCKHIMPHLNISSFIFHGLYFISYNISFNQVYHSGILSENAR